MSETPINAKKLPSPRERLDLILLGLGRREPATRLCEQAGVSRELFYRWMRAVKEAGLKALEAKAPGPKRIVEEKAPAQALKLGERVGRLEKELKGLRKDRDHWKLLAEVAQRIIRRQSWGPAPREASKKNAMRDARRGNAMPKSGPRSADTAPQPGSSPSAGGLAEARTGAGSAGTGAPPEGRS